MKSRSQRPLKRGKSNQITDETKNLQKKFQSNEERQAFFEKLMSFNDRLMLDGKGKKFSPHQLKN